MAQTPIKASTQEHLDIEDIYDDLVILKNSGASLVIQTTAVNFGLLSETEQDAIIYAYAGLLNSLSFPIQVVIRSKRMDVSSYLESLIKWEQKQANEKIRIQIRKYREFITSTIRENNVLDKRFYVVIPMFPEEIGLGATSPLSRLQGKSKTPKYPKEYVIERAKNILLPRRDHLIRQLNRLGLKSTQLSTQQLIELFYDIYNPSVTGVQKLAARSNEYLSPLVSSSAEISAPHVPTTSLPNQTTDRIASDMSPAEIFDDKNTQNNLPSSNWQSTIQNANLPWPTNPTPQIDENTSPLTSGAQIPIPPAPPISVTQTQTPELQQEKPQDTSEAIRNLQKAIESARKNASQYNTAQNISNIPSVQANFDK